MPNFHICENGFYTNVDVFQAALNAYLSVRDWDFFIDFVPDEMMSMVYVRLADFTIQELEVSCD